MVGSYRSGVGCLTSSWKLYPLHQLRSSSSRSLRNTSLRFGDPKCEVDRDGSHKARGKAGSVGSSASRPATSSGWRGPEVASSRDVLQLPAVCDSSLKPPSDIVGSRSRIKGRGSERCVVCPSCSFWKSSRTASVVLTSNRFIGMITSNLTACPIIKVAPNIFTISQ